MKKIKHRGGLIFLWSLVLFGCVDKEYDFNRISTEIVYDPKLAFTLGTLTIDLESLLKGYINSNNLKIAEDKTIVVAIETNFYSPVATDNLSLPPQSNIIIPGFIFPPVMPAAGVVSRDTTINIPISFFDDAEIDSMRVKILQYTLNGTSTYSAAFTQELTISLLDMRSRTLVYAESFPVTPSMNVTNQNNAAGYLLKFRNITPGSAETRLYVRLTLRGTAGTPINPASSLNLSMQINQLNYDLLYGYIGQPYLLDIIDTMYLDLLGKDFAKNIEWKNTSYMLYQTNTYVAPTDF
ncbi:MAG: hypothetical protein ACP5PS_07335, partial [Bacteroidales bacterium]